MEIIIQGIKMSLIKVNKNENPYHIIGDYIEKHITCVDDIIAVISINNKIYNELLLVEITTESNFIWQRDWWEGEESVELVDFFFVSDACKRYDNNDLISRQQAIDVLGEKPIAWQRGEYEEGLQTRWESDVEAIKELPSAQPEKRTEKHTEMHGVCLDAINRQAAIDVFYELWGTSLTRTVDAIKQLPPIQPKRGKWIVHYECPKCGEITKDFTEYCPFCNADMRGEQDG